MKLNNLTITKQFSMGLGSILLLVVIFGVNAWFTANSLWHNTQELHDHPLTVRRAIGEIEKDILYMRIEINEVISEKNGQKIEEHLQKIDTYEADAYSQLNILYSQYLGPRQDIDAAYNSLVQWRSIHDETIRLFREGKVDEVMNRTKSAGIDEVNAEKVMGYLETVSNFAKNKTEQFYTDAQVQKNNLMMQLILFLVTTLLLSIGISIFLLRGIRIPLKELTYTTEAFRQGKLNARSSYESANEFGILARAFNSMADTVQSEMLGKDNISRVSAVMFHHDKLRPFCQELLMTLLPQTGSQIGAVYLLNEQKTDFEHFESIGLSGSCPSFPASRFEGEFGLVLATQQIQCLTDIPADTQFTFSTVSGNFKPKEIITIPIHNGPNVIAVISLASIQNHSAAAVQLVNNIWSELTARLNGVLALKQIGEYSQKLQNTNIELEAQAKELLRQTDELTEQNIELEMQKKLLDEASQLKSRFLSNMSHELRTPLNSVIALASVLNRRLQGVIPEEEYSYLDVIERNGKNLLLLVNDILDLSRIEAGKEEVTLSHFKVRVLVDEVVEMIQPQAQEKQLLLLNNVSNDLPSITSDMSKCRHILQNLVGNALKFTKEGQVEISAALVNDEIHIAVSDTGIGIAADKLIYIFDEFRQVDETASRETGGTGLGLAIANKYAQMLRGSIAVESTLDYGSTFTLKLPLLEDGSTSGEDMERLGSQGAADSSDQHLRPVGLGKNILLVEDSEPAIIQMKDILTESGYRIYVARNGQEALEHIEKFLPDAIILDLMMPEVDGFQVLESIRRVKKTAQIPVMILTAKHITKEELKFLKGNHIFQLVQKGAIGKNELLSVIRHMVTIPCEPQRPPAIRPARIKAVGRPVILVVEDNSDNMTTVKALLQENYEIIEATNGQTGIEQAAKFRPALILLDISLPVMDGFEVLGKLREDGSLQHIPVIALTARAMNGSREEILAHGFDGYISKPIDGKMLEETIRGILDAE
jgi:signal transduction histidine kinase/DNA-binding response OmpR family regulator/HAMP domain-containing protein